MAFDDDRLVSVAQLKEFVKLSQDAIFTSKDTQEAYTWIGTTLGKFRYFGETKKHRGIIKRYLMQMTGYSETQTDRLIARKKETGVVLLQERTQPTFPRIYTTDDIA